MACPHVSGVVALGLSYAVQLKKHFKATEIKELLYQSARPFESQWSLMEGYPSKNYYKYVASQQQVHFTSINLDGFRGKMGHGLVDAARFLEAIENGGAPMVFPNVFVKVNGTKTYELTSYMDKPAGNGKYTCTVNDGSIANVEIEGTKLTVEGYTTGQTVATVTNGKDVHKFVITISASATSNGWM